MAFEEKGDWYTTVCERLKIDPNVAIEAVLDKLFDNSATDVYYPAERIEVE